MVVSAAFVLGVAYALGQKGKKKDDAKAATLFRKACDGGDAQGCYNLGVYYDGHKAVANGGAKAVALYRKACAGGDEDACGKATPAHGNR